MSARRRAAATESAPRNADDIRKFAAAYADPTSPTYDDRAASFLVVRPNVSRKSARDIASRWLQTETCQKAIEEVKLGVRIESGLTRAGYIQLLLERSTFYKNRGAKGDAIADAKCLELLGKAGGFLVTKVEDVTPPERRLPPLSSAQMVALMTEQLERLRRLNAPVPAAPLPGLREIAAASSREVSATPTPELLAAPAGTEQ